MGFFSNLGDTFSGKNQKRSELIFKKIEKLLNKQQRFSGNDLVVYFLSSMILSISIDLEFILFKEEGGEINVFKKNINSLDEEKTFEFMKLLVTRYLSSFKRNVDFDQIIKVYNIKTKQLEEEVFTFFSFTRENEKDYKELDNIFDENTSKYFRILTEKILNKAYGMNSDASSIADQLFLQLITSDTYNNVFIENLSEKLNN